MARSQFVDFKAVKAAITMEQVLEHYGLLDKFKRIGDSLSGPCPIHKGSNATQFRVSTTKNVWNCFSECKNGGNTLDFIAKMDDVSILAAANKAIEWFHLDPKEMSVDSPEAIKGNRCFKGLIILGVLRCSNRRLRRIAFPAEPSNYAPDRLHQSLFAVVKA